MPDYMVMPRVKRILYVEDDRCSQDYVKFALEKRKGYKIDIAADAIQALALLTCRRYDAIILDYHLPLISPDQAERALRKARVPICYFTCDAASVKRATRGIPVIRKVREDGEGGVQELERVLENIMREPLPDDYDKTRHITTDELEEARRPLLTFPAEERHVKAL